MDVYADNEEDAIETASGIDDDVWSTTDPDDGSVTIENDPIVERMEYL